MDGRIEQSGGCHTGHLSNQRPHQTFLRDGQLILAGPERTEHSRNDGAQGILNQSENAQREEQEIEHSSTLVLGKRPGGQSEHEESVNERRQKGRQNSGAYSKDRYLGLCQPKGRNESSDRRENYSGT